MRSIILFSLLVIGLGPLNGQNTYRSVYDVEDDWQNFTEFQKHEMISFSNFLFSEGFYDRALLTYFQYLYRYPGDSLEPVVYYHIARCYEITNNPDLALKYYRRILEDEDSTSVAFRAAYYRNIYLQLIQGNIDSVLAGTSDTDDPYLLVFRGFAFLKRLEWLPARQSFLAAEERFNHAYYSELLAPIFQAIDNASNVPLRGRGITILTALVPGGGRAYLRQWDSAVGTMLTTTLLYSVVAGSGTSVKGKITYQEPVMDYIPTSGSVKYGSDRFTQMKHTQIPGTVNLKSTGIKLLVPAVVIGVGVYVGSILKTVQDVDAANLELVKMYVSELFDKNPIAPFLDFPEPEFAIKP